MDDMMISEGKLLHGKYEMGRLLGHGTFAKVYVARNVHSGVNVAMKVVGKEKVVKVGMMEQVKREISVMKMVSHPNIVELHEVMANKSKIYFAMELVRGGELFKQIAKSGRLKESIARSYFRQLISAVDFCHSRGVYHRDLKPENLLLDDEGNLKVADFGLSALADHTRPDGLFHTTCGTPAYVAPEVIKKKGYDGAKADIWSCGVILYVLLAGRLPFHDENLVNMYKKIHRGDFKCPPWFSPEARRLVTKLLDPNPNTRITIAKLLQTPWFRRSSSMPVISSDAVAGRWGKDKPEMLTAFHIISLSEGFDLSPMFEERRRDRDGELRFATRESAAGVTERLEKAGEGMFNVRKSELEVRLESLAIGRRGRVAVVAEMFPVAPSVLVVEVKRESGDEFEYGRFCAETLRPALVDIMWASSDSKENDVVLN